jgi:NAD(P)-dependent dehydrogenase (short-subunit alcohol dehydrogenase family)
MSNPKIKNQIALVTGANRGIGLALTRELLNQGASKVYAAVRNTQSTQALEKEFGDRIQTVALDLDSSESIQGLVQKIPKLDILINNSGVLHPGALLDATAAQDVKKHLQVNLLGLIELTTGLAPLIKESKAGVIASISSMAGLANMPLIGSYSVSKAAVHSVIQGYRAELKSSGVLVAGIYPGLIDTEMVEGFPMEKDSPQNLAKHTIEALKNGIEDIYPDQMSAPLGELYSQKPKELESAFAEYIAQPSEEATA